MHLKWSEPQPYSALNAITVRPPLITVMSAPIGGVLWSGPSFIRQIGSSSNRLSTLRKSARPGKVLNASMKQANTRIRTEKTISEERGPRSGTETETETDTEKGKEPEIEIKIGTETKVMADLEERAHPHYFLMTMIVGIMMPHLVPTIDHLENVPSLIGVRALFIGGPH